MGESCPQLLRLDTELKIYYLSLISGSWPFIRMDKSRKEMLTSSSANTTPAQTAIIRKTIKAVLLLCINHRDPRA